MNRTSKLVALSHIETIIADLWDDENEDWQEAMFKIMKGLSFAHIVLGDYELMGEDLE